MPTERPSPAEQPAEPTEARVSPIHGHRELFPRAFAEGRSEVLPRFRVMPAAEAPPASAARPDPTDLPAAVAPVTEIIAGRRLAVLTGAGISTDSGVPDYRSPGTPPRQPMTFQQFLAGETYRRHYWARNHLGWRHLAQARPNAGHRAVAALEAGGLVTGVITQNIDLLHLRAGSGDVVHLHGRYDRVVCHSCGATTSRAELDDRLGEANPGWRERQITDVEIAPDADAVLAATDDFRTVGCARCGGILVPDVVFFGSNTPRTRVLRARQMVDDAEALLVAGTSLAVMSGLRFVRQAQRSGLPVVVINRGPVREGELVTHHLEAGTSEALTELVDQLGLAPPSANPPGGPGSPGA